METFRKYQDFIISDIRTDRKGEHGYTVTCEMMQARHSVLLPESLVKNRSVLDLGCCVAATGAWVLDHGAAQYVGVELQKTFATRSHGNLSKYFAHDRWQIVQCSIESYLQNSDKFYDVIFLGGVLYTSLYYQNLLAQVAAMAQNAIVIESMMPRIISDKLKDMNLASDDQLSEYYPVVEYRSSRTGNMVHEECGNFKVNSAVPSLQSLVIYLEEFGFHWDPRSYEKFKQTDYTGWPYRFGAIFYKQSEGLVKSTENYYQNEIIDTISWNHDAAAPWKFDHARANIFPAHARRHIPDYDKVIDLSVNLCKTLLTNPFDDRIIDVGCAVGETIDRLYKNGCCNLIGVDSSQAMLDRCDKLQAWYVCSKDLPVECGPYSAVICNWTMHFMDNKLEYLSNIYNNLCEGGFLILTEKTQNHGVALDLYHKWKRYQGVSEEEITAKAQSLKGVMFIDSIDWYLINLKQVGFKNISVINAAPCFTSFLAFRDDHTPRAAIDI